jgi:signal transduction histidine kinase
LPLSGSTAESIASALLECDFASSLLAERLQATLEVDAAFALWATLLADKRAGAELKSTSELAAWLATVLVDAWTETLAADQTPAELPLALAKKQAAWIAESYGIATLAAEIARQHALDESQAYLLGLLHLAPQWLSGNQEQKRSTPSTSHAPLPRWLAEAHAAIETSTAGQFASSADCVALALRASAAPARSTSGAAGVKFDRRRHKARGTAIGKTWLAPSPAPAWLPALATRLKRAHALETEYQRMLETEKLESLKELAYGAGHEINNPLANISARAQTLLIDETDPERRRLLAAINAQAFRAHEMIADMMLFARPPKLHPASTDLVALVQTVFDQFVPKAAAQQVELGYQAPSSPIVAAIDPTQIHEALSALCANALEALVTGGRIELAIRNAGDGAQISVADTGPGISAEVRRHMFDPYYSGREAGRGLGFGLSKCWRIVRLHGGQVDVSCPNTGGATFTITVPATAKP